MIRGIGRGTELTKQKVHGTHLLHCPLILLLVLTRTWVGLEFRRRIPLRGRLAGELGGDNFSPRIIFPPCRLAGG